MGFRYYAVRDMKASGFDTLSIVVWLMCKEARGSLVKAKVGIRTLFGADDNLVSKFAAECVKGNQTPWAALAKLRLRMPEDGSAVRKERLEPAAIASAARAASTYWSERYGDLA